MAATDSADDRWTGMAPGVQPLLTFSSRRRIARPLIGAGVAVVLGIAFGFGVVALRNLEPDALEPEATAVAIPVEIAAPAPAPEPAKAAAPLEVLPNDMAQAAAPRPVIQAPPTPRADSTPRADPTFDCRRPDTPSERVVCSDAELLRLDRSMNRAFNEAVAAGVPVGSLRQDQDDWLRVREDAARFEGPDGVAGMYRQRIAELREMAANFAGAPPAQD